VLESWIDPSARLRRLREDFRNSRRIFEPYQDCAVEPTRLLCMLLALLNIHRLSLRKAHSPNIADLWVYLCLARGAEERLPHPSCRAIRLDQVSQGDPGYRTWFVRGRVDVAVAQLESDETVAAIWLGARWMDRTRFVIKRFVGLSADRHLARALLVRLRCRWDCAVRLASKSHDPGRTAIAVSAVYVSCRHCGRLSLSPGRPTTWLRRRRKEASQTEATAFGVTTWMTRRVKLSPDWQPSSVLPRTWRSVG